MPVNPMTKIVKTQPACTDTKGRTRIDPPIIPLTSATTVVGKFIYLCGVPAIKILFIISMILILIIKKKYPKYINAVYKI